MADPRRYGQLLLQNDPEAMAGQEISQTDWRPLAKTAEVPGTQLFKACGDVYVALLDEGERQRLGLPDNFMAKKQVRAEAIPGTSKGKGTPVTNMKWTPVAT